MNEVQNQIFKVDTTYIKDNEEKLGGIEPETISQLCSIFISARSAMARFLSLLEAILKSSEVSPGKLQEEVG